MADTVQNQLSPKRIAAAEAAVCFTKNASSVSSARQFFFLGWMIVNENRCILPVFFFSL